MKSILSAASEITTPSAGETEKVDGIVDDIITKVTKAARSKRVYGELMVGGSVGKGSWLPGSHDLDFFFRFDYTKYHKRNDELSDLLEKVLRHIFTKVDRVHGSRDYFQVKVGKRVAEIIPVLKISKISDAMNLTDASPLHVDWVRNKVSKSKILLRDLRLAKMFFKAQRSYGAESFISGFSGHVVEILTCHYGSFEKLLKASQKWKVGQVIDVEKHYKNAESALEALNEEKKKSPIIVIDPIEASRNAAASLREEVYNRLVGSAAAFIAKPTIKAFDTTLPSLDEIKKMERKTKKLVGFQAHPEEGKKDVIGSKLLKQYKAVLDLFKSNDFDVLECDWFWDQEGPAMFCYFVDPKELPKTKIIKGPITYGTQEHIMAFKRKYARRKVWRQGYNYYVELPRKLRKIQDVTKQIKSDGELSNLKLLK